MIKARIYKNVLRDIKMDNEKEFIIPEGVTAIAPGILQDTTFEKIVFPSTLNFLPDEACKDNKYLKTVVFNNCTLNGIPKGTFEDCINLENVEISNDIVIFSHRAFASCTSLKSINLPAGFLKVDTEAFAYSGIEEFIGSPSLREIGQNAFYKCKNLKTVELPDHMQHICDYAFAKCESLKEIEVPDFVHIIRTGTFQDCINLEKIKFNESLNRISNYSFQNCRKLKAIIFPASLNSVCRGAFNNCMHLEELHFNSKTYIDKTAFPDIHLFKQEKIKIYTPKINILENTIPENLLKVSEVFVDDYTIDDLLEAGMSMSKINDTFVKNKECMEK